VKQGQDDRDPVETAVALTGASSYDLWV